MSDLIAALGLALFIEGVLYAAFPEQMKSWLAHLVAQPANRLRGVALGCAAFGLVVLFMVRG